MSKTWILGPCSIENADLFIGTLAKINEVMKSTDDWYMKASFDKANRTSLHGGRGPGLDESISIWKDARAQFPNVKFITDVHECWQVEKLAGVVDVIQIPAFLCRQTDLIVETAKHFDNFGYHDLFVNFGIVDELKEHYDKVILDCTHSIQRSRAVYGTQGDRKLAERYFLTADLFNYDGVFAEVHPDPKNSVSDADCQLNLLDLDRLVNTS